MADILGEFMDFFRATSFIRLIVILWGGYYIVTTSLEVVRDILKNREFEHSRREIAAYVAEKNITPDQGVALLSIYRMLSKEEEAETEDAGKKLAGLVAWGSIEQSDAARIIAERHHLTEDRWKELVELVEADMPVDEAIALIKARSGVAVVGPAMA